MPVGGAGGALGLPRGAGGLPDGVGVLCTAGTDGSFFVAPAGGGGFSFCVLLAAAFSFLPSFFLSKP